MSPPNRWSSHLKDNIDNDNINRNTNADDLEAQRVSLIPVVEARQLSTTSPAQYGTLSDANGDCTTAAPVVTVMAGSMPEPETDYWALFLGIVV